MGGGCWNVGVGEGSFWGGGGGGGKNRVPFQGFGNGRNLSFLIVLFTSTCDIAMRNSIRRVVVNYLMYTISV